MKAVVQLVKRASVLVDRLVISEIGKGLLVFLGVESDDTLEDIDYLSEKIINLRIFHDESNKMNLSLRQISAEILVVSQFTICGDVRKGNRPSFTSAANAEKAKDYYDKFTNNLRNRKFEVREGLFRAHMEVSLINDGPVTILLDSRKNF